MVTRRASWVPAVLLVCTSSVAGQQPRNGPGGEPPLNLPRIDGLIVIDGRVEEAAWAGAVLLEGVVQVPDFGATPTQRGEFLLAHDGEYLYLACGQ